MSNSPCNLSRMRITKDNFLFPNVLSWLLILLSYGLMSKDSTLFSIIFLVDIWLLSHPHALVTFFKKQTYQKFSLKSLGLIFGVTVVALTLVAKEKGQVGLYFIYFFWQWFHYFRQNYGISFHLLESQSKTVRRVEYAFNHVMPLLAILVLFSKGPLDFLGHYIPFFDFQAGRMAFQTTFLGLFLLWLGWSLFQLFKTERGGHFAYFVNTFSSFALYYFSYIFAEHFIYGWLGLTIFHNVQYLYFTFKDKNFHWSFLNKARGPSFYGVLTLFSVAVYGLIFLGTDLISSPFLPMALIAVFSLNILHYVVDSFIWRS